MSNFLRFAPGPLVVTLPPSSVGAARCRPSSLSTRVAGYPPSSVFRRGSSLSTFLHCQLGLFVFKLFLFRRGLLVLDLPPFSAGASCCQPSCVFRGGCALSTFLCYQSWCQPCAFRSICFQRELLVVNLLLFSVGAPRCQASSVSARPPRWQPSSVSTVAAGCLPRSVFNLAVFVVDLLLFPLVILVGHFPLFHLGLLLSAFSIFPLRSLVVDLPPFPAWGPHCQPSSALTGAAGCRPLPFSVGAPPCQASSISGVPPPRQPSSFLCRAVVDRPPFSVGVPCCGSSSFFRWVSLLSAVSRWSCGCWLSTFLLRVLWLLVVNHRAFAGGASRYQPASVSAGALRC